jgi:hypothetical protein
MAEDFCKVKAEFSSLAHVSLGARSIAWKRRFDARVDPIQGDRDVIAVNQQTGRLLIVEVEGVSSGQPETKVYKAVGQAIAATSCKIPENFVPTIGVAVVGARLADHLKRCSVLATLGVFGVRLDEQAAAFDDWVFGRPTWL